MANVQRRENVGGEEEGTILLKGGGIGKTKVEMQSFDGSMDWHATKITI